MRYHPHPSTAQKNIDWKLGMSNAEQTQTVTVGGNIIFKWSDIHNVWSLPNKAAYDACDFSQGIELAPTSVNEYIYKASSTGIVYFSCQVFGHCKYLDQKLALTVTATQTPATTPSPNTCSKCSTNKNGRRTCCALGGSWFQKCGRNSKFDHTFEEGYLACKSSSSVELSSAEVQGQSLVSNHTTPSQEREAEQQETIDFISVRTSNVHSGDVSFTGSDKRSTFTAIITSLVVTTHVLLGS